MGFLEVNSNRWLQCSIRVDPEMTMATLLIVGHTNMMCRLIKVEVVITSDSY